RIGNERRDTARRPEPPRLKQVAPRAAFRRSTASGRGATDRRVGRDDHAAVWCARIRVSRSDDGAFAIAAHAGLSIGTHRVLAVIDTCAEGTMRPVGAAHGLTV